MVTALALLCEACSRRKVVLADVGATPSASRRSPKWWVMTSVSRGPRSAGLEGRKDHRVGGCHRLFWLCRWLTSLRSIQMGRIVEGLMRRTITLLVISSAVSTAALVTSPHGEQTPSGRSGSPTRSPNGRSRRRRLPTRFLAVDAVLRARVLGSTVRDTNDVAKAYALGGRRFEVAERRWALMAQDVSRYRAPHGWTRQSVHASHRRVSHRPT